MLTNVPRRIFLIGPSGSGKSSVAQHLALQLGYMHADTDEIVEERIGMTIGEFFAHFGEAAFRAIETEVLKAIAGQDGLVVATGGGIVLSPDNWTLMRPRSAIIGLTASPETLAERIEQHQESEGIRAIRPLLEGDGLQRIKQLIADRAPLYQRADVTIDTSRQTLDEVVASVQAIVTEEAFAKTVPHLTIATPTTRSDIVIDNDILDQLPAMIERRWPSAPRIWLVSDENVFAVWGDQVGGLLSELGSEVHPLTVPAGEQSKSLDRVAALVERMTKERAGRRDIVVALGGGVVGDLAGFIAAVCLRGLPLVQVPTSLLAMVDSSVGGKTGVNTSAGKNLVGAFYQPDLVAVEPRFLSTLPIEEYRSGMAEVIKHSVIQPSTPLGGTSLLELLDSVDSFEEMEPSDLVQMLRLNVAIKHSVVQEDERESRLRMILNFGHTAGHAIEADGYRYRHGEAVALGMQVATWIAILRGDVEASTIERLRSLIARAGLPVELEGDHASIMGRMVFDKKNVDGALNWILPAAAGGVEIRSDVTPDHIEEALARVSAGAPVR